MAINPHSRYTLHNLNSLYGRALRHGECMETMEAAMRFAKLTARYQKMRLEDVLDFIQNNEDDDD